MNARSLLSAVLTVSFFLPCTQAAAQEAAPVATVNGTAIPRTRFERAMAVVTQRGAKDTQEVRNNVLEELIVREVVQQEAARRGLDKTPEFAAALEEQRRNLLVQIFAQDHLRRNPVPDAAVKAEYDRLAAEAAKKPDQKVMTYEQAAPRLRAALEQQSVRQAAAALRKQAKVE